MRIASMLRGRSVENLPFSPLAEISIYEGNSINPCQSVICNANLETYNVREIIFDLKDHIYIYIYGFTYIKF